MGDSAVDLGFGQPQHEQHDGDQEGQHEAADQQMMCPGFHSLPSSPATAQRGGDPLSKCSASSCAVTAAARARGPWKYSLTQGCRSSSLADIGPLISTFFRSEEQTSDLQSLLRTSYAVICLNKK